MNVTVSGCSTRRWLLPLLVLVLLPGCMIRDAYRQISAFGSACFISGQVLEPHGSPGPYIVAVIDAGTAADADQVVPVDFFVLERPGDWAFALAPGRYQLATVHSQDGHLGHEADARMVFWQQGRALDCASGDRIDDLVMDMGGPFDEDSPWRLELSRQRSGVLGDQAVSLASLGQATAFGAISTLDHARFSMEVGRDSLWRPLDFILDGHAGVYFLEPYDPRRTPVLFVHGINGSPRVFEALIASLDRERFQPWVYYYPSGIGLNENSDYLTHIMLELELRLDLSSYHVVAHSMGGLVAWSFLNRRQQRQAPAKVGQFIALSAPWGGHLAAARAVESSPLVLPVWKDMASGSEFLDQLFDDSEGANGINKHLLFSYGEGEALSRGTTDGVITLSSLLRAEAQDRALSIYGFGTSHIGILSDLRAIDRVNQLLADLP